MTTHTTEPRVLREARAIVDRMAVPDTWRPFTECPARRRIDPVATTTWGLVALGLTAFWVTVFALVAGWRPG